MPDVTGGRKHKLADRGDDLYETPAEATRALMAIERLPHRIWEPACGPGAIVRVLRAAGHDVLATDLVDYTDRPDSEQDDAGLAWDFLSPLEGITDNAIVTNPPYKLAQAFIEQAIERAPLVCMLMRLQFLAGTRRAPILDKLARVHVSARRLPMMHRDGWRGPRTSSTQDHAWFVWDREHTGPAIVSRFDWKDFI